MTDKLPQPQFAGMRRPTSDFESVRSRLQAQMRHYDVDLSTARSLAAGTALQLPLEGNFLYVDQKQNGGFARVFLQDGNAAATPVTIYPGWLGRIPYVQPYLENDAQAGVTMRILHGTDVEFDATTGAGVSLLTPALTVDSNGIRTANGSSFMGVNTQAALAGNTAPTQLWNPAGSSTRPYVKAVHFFSTTANQAVGVYSYGNPLGAAPANAPNKLLTGAASIAQLRGINLAAQPGALMWQGILNANYTKVEFHDPIIIPANWGLYGCSVTALNADLTVTFDFYEQ